MAHYGGVTVWSTATGGRACWRGRARTGRRVESGRATIVSGMQENALHGWRLSDAGDIEMGGYPGQPRSLSFSAMAVPGEQRWPARGVLAVRSAGARAPTECGIAEPHAGDPRRLPSRRPLIAAGYHNGAVLLCQPGSDDVLFVRGAGGGAVERAGLEPWMARRSRSAPRAARSAW